jgi:hypothetical protein
MSATRKPDLLYRHQGRKHARTLMSHLNRGSLIVEVLFLDRK